MKLDFVAMRHYVSYLARGGRPAKKASPLEKREPARPAGGNTMLEMECLEVMDFLTAGMKEREARIRPKVWAFVMAALADQLKREEKWPTETSES